MVSSVFVELVGEAGEAPPNRRSGDEGYESFCLVNCASGVGEVDIAGMEVKGHVTIPVLLAGSHI